MILGIILSSGYFFVFLFLLRDSIIHRSGWFDELGIYLISFPFSYFSEIFNNTILKYAVYIIGGLFNMTVIYLLGWGITKIVKYFIAN